MRTRTAACTALLALTMALTACSSGSDAKADPAACKTAMTKQLRDGIAKGDDAPEGKRPAACEGVDAKTLQRYATEILQKELPKAIESALPSPGSVPSTAGNRDGAFITAVQDAGIEFTTMHPSNDELAAFPPKWCTELEAGHSVNYLFDDTDGAGLYPYGDGWGMEKKDANELLVVGVKTYCPEHLEAVQEELRANGEY